MCCALGRIRTGTPGGGHQLLGLARLPVPPRARSRRPVPPRAVRRTRAVAPLGARRRDLMSCWGKIRTCTDLVQSQASCRLDDPASCAGEGTRTPTGRWPTEV